MAYLACAPIFTVCLCVGCKTLFPHSYACCPTCGCDFEPELRHDPLYAPTVREDHQIGDFAPELMEEPKRR